MMSVMITSWVVSQVTLLLKGCSGEVCERDVVSRYVGGKIRT